MTTPPLLEVRGLTKRYGTFTALEPTDLIVEAGSIHGFLGKNGAGKSTLVKIIAGSETPSGGQIFYKGQDITDLSLAKRRKLGINLLSQHAEVIHDLSVAENLVLPDYPTSSGFLSPKKMRTLASNLLAKYNLDFDLDVRAGDLAAPDQRRLSIVRTLVDDGALAMLDEPTTSLSQAERVSLFEWMHELNERGQTFVFISHYSSEIQAVCKTVTVLRDGRVVADGNDPRTMTAQEISELVVGDAVDEYHRARRVPTETKVIVENLDIDSTGPVSFTVGKGEVLGFVGLPGSGAQESARALAGLSRPSIEKFEIDGNPVRSGKVKDANAAGIAYLTNDRHGEGIVGPFSVRESLVLGRWPTAAGLIDSAAIRKVYDRFHDRMKFRVSGPSQPIEELSGGNQQKIILSRLLASSPQLLILDEPTLGVDVSTKEEIHRIINELTEHGMSVIVLAYDIDEMVRVADRILAFQDGRVAAELSGDEITADSVLAHLNHHANPSAAA